MRTNGSRTGGSARPDFILRRIGNGERTVRPKIFLAAGRSHTEAPEKRRAVRNILSQNCATQETEMREPCSRNF